MINHFDIYTFFKSLKNMHSLEIAMWHHYGLNDILILQKMFRARPMYHDTYYLQPYNIRHAIFHMCFDFTNSIINCIFSNSPFHNSWYNLERQMVEIVIFYFGFTATNNPSTPSSSSSSSKGNQLPGVLMICDIIPNTAVLVLQFSSARDKFYYYTTTTTTTALTTTITSTDSLWILFANENL